MCHLTRQTLRKLASFLCPEDHGLGLMRPGNVVQVFAGLLVGAMLPYWFSAMTMKSVGKAALAMVEEVRRQFNTIQGLMEGTARPDYRQCVEISTQV